MEWWREYCDKYADKKGKIYSGEASGFFTIIIGDLLDEIKRLKHE